MKKLGVMAALALSLALADCATTPSLFSASSSSSSGSRNLLNMNDNPPVDASLGQRDLSPSEKKVIADAVALSIKDPGSAKYRWARISNSADGSVNYCATVEAKSAYPAYNGRQAYIVETTVSGGKVSSAVVGLIAGGKDAAIVSKMCAKYGLNPNDAT